MDLSPYLDALRRDLAASAAVGGADMTAAAEQLSGSLDAAARLCLMEALADATAEITSQLGTTSVEVRLRGREADLVVTELTEIAGPEPEPEPAPPTTTDGSSDVARITLRLPEGLKEQVETAAAGDGISVNAWLVRAIAGAVSGRSGRPDRPGPAAPSTPPFPAGRASYGKRVTGYAQA